MARNLVVVLLLVHISQHVVAQQNGREESPQQFEAYHSYRDLLLPLDQVRLRKDLGLSPEQLQLYSNVTKDAQRPLPSFDLLEQGDNAFGRFFASLDVMQERADREFFTFFDEGLTPSQSDPLLGMYLILRGVDGLRHDAFRRRLALSEDQEMALGKALADDRENQRARWRNTAMLTSVELTENFDFRANRRLGIVKTFLKEEQLEVFAHILSVTPKYAPQRLALGL